MDNKLYLRARFCARIDELSNWINTNPVLDKGEPAIISDGVDGKWLKFGDGVTPFNDLPFMTFPKGPKGDRGADGIQGPKGDNGDKGEKGDSYILTESDKGEIAETVKSMFVDVAEVGR